MSLMKTRKKQRALLALADGTVFSGQSFGFHKDVEEAAVGEVVFNTSMYGYQEILTDPSYAGQIMCFTYPHIGNVGCNEQDIESNSICMNGVIIRNETATVSNFRATTSLHRYLEDSEIMGLSGIDTRGLVKHIRDHGAQMGAIACGETTKSIIDDLVSRAKKAGSMEGKDYVQFVSCKEPYSWHELPWSLQTLQYGKLKDEELRPHVVAVDCGIKFNILRLLLESGFRVTVVPATFSSEQILHLQPDALFLSNGPGDPATLGYIVSTVKELLGKLPLFGICLGHQILAQVLGGKTFKLKFGHRGGNHPVKDLSTEKVEITVQNHGFAVDPDSLPSNVHITHLNLNDGTVEGLDAPDQAAFSVQYHPEASSGPQESKYLFERFFHMVVGYHGNNPSVAERK